MPPDTLQTPEVIPATDPRLGRLIQIDKRSLSFPVSETLEAVAKKPRSYTWRCKDFLDQGQEGACVGFAWSHELSARPSEVKGITGKSARAVYEKAKTLDPWPGEDYEGTSVLAGAKAVMQLHPGKLLEYRWAFTVDDVLRTLSYLGPVVLGINWHEGMMEVDGKGYIRRTGRNVGGHCILANGVDLRRKAIHLHNSWGKKWGVEGGAFLSFDDLERLLGEYGEACVPVRRGVEKRRVGE